MYRLKLSFINWIHIYWSLIDWMNLMRGYIPPEEFWIGIESDNQNLSQVKLILDKILPSVLSYD